MVQGEVQLVNGCLAPSKMTMESFTFAADQLFFAGKVAMLMKGTSDDDSPIPGYLYKEISDISYQSPAHCQFLLEFLVKRMSKSSCHVKFKTLKLMKHVVENGDPNFRAGLRTMSKCIQEATKFGGIPDPLHGNLPYQAVRKTAKELCQILFDVGQEPRVQSDQSQTHLPAERMVGIGPTHTSSGGKYQGFGNMPAPKKSLGNTIREGLEKLAEQLGDTAPAQRQAALLADLENSSGDYVPPVVTPAVQPPHPKATSESSKPAVTKHVPGRAGGGWDDDPKSSAQSQGSGTRSEASSELSYSRLEAVSSPDWSAEEQLVTDHLLVNDTSQFFLLQPSDMKVFKRKCQGLNCEKVVDFIRQRLQSPEDYIVVRAMLLLETFLVRSDAVSLDYIVSACQHQLVNLFDNNTDQRVKDKAGKIIRGLECYSSYSNILASTDGQS